MTPHPPASSPAVRARMQAQRTRDTAPELALRRELHALGLRYRLHRQPVPGLRRTVDLTFGPARVAVEVRGCFWHGCPDHPRAPGGANSAWWAAKIAATRARDADTEARLAAAGWVVAVVWEHEDPTAAAERVRVLVAARRASPAGAASRPPPCR